MGHMIELAILSNLALALGLLTVVMTRPKYAAPRTSETSCDPYTMHQG